MELLKPSQRQMRMCHLIRTLIAREKSDQLTGKESSQIKEQDIEELEGLLKEAAFDEIDAAHTIVREEIAANA